MIIQNSLKFNILKELVFNKEHNHLEGLTSHKTQNQAKSLKLKG
jgi:hypothetical protein